MSSSIFHRVLQRSSIISVSLGMDHLGLDTKDAKAKSKRNPYVNLRIPRQRLYFRSN